MEITLTDKGEIVLAADELSRFAKKKVRTGAIDYRPSTTPYGDPDVFFSSSYKMVKGGEVFILTGEPDGIYEFDRECIVEMRRSVKKLSPSSTPYSDPAFLAKAFICAFLVCKEKKRDYVTLKVTLCGATGERHFDLVLSDSFLTRVTEDLVERAAFFASVKKKFFICGKRDIAAMPFPYTSIRDGQRDFITEAYRTIKRHGRLLVCAPTGTGKTISALFPAVKALGEGEAEKIFYLTAKTVTGLAAAKTAQEISRHVPDFRTVMITAKERCCPSNNKKIDFYVDRCSFDCPRLTDGEGGDYNTRRDRALTELLSGGVFYDKEAISAAAEKYGVCPYELSLDLSEYCQLIICDYNYAVDPRVKFRRYFVDGASDYIFLIDEAHNLPDRARETFSASLNRSDVVKLKDELFAAPSPNAELASRCSELIEALDYISERCLENSEIFGEERTGHLIEDHVPNKLLKALEAFVRTAGRARTDAAQSELIDEVYSSASDMCKCAEYFDEHFVFFATQDGSGLTVRIMCLDPSSILDRAMSHACCAILFSATLTPAEYFADVTGCSSASVLELESPYPTENLCVAAVDTVSTKYIARGDTASEIARMILTAISAKSGHYIVYFPSYKYMQTVFTAFGAIAPKGIGAVVQKPSMSLDARRKFLSYFENEKSGDTIVGFCVLGGVFSEGIDLPDEKLIGAILVGIGLPSLSSELNVLKEYYDKTREDGYNFAYLYPAMIKIAQAAGRVIRGERDRGVVVLIDERYRDPGIIKLLPAHWRDLHYTGNEASLAKYLSDFWNK